MCIKKKNNNKKIAAPLKINHTPQKKTHPQKTLHKTIKSIIVEYGECI